MHVTNLTNYQVITEGNAIFDTFNNLVFRGKNYTKRFVLVDENTERDCLPILLKEANGPLITIRIPSGEIHKKLETSRQVWQTLFDHNADRHSLLINLGGGVIGDLGGFCAATFKRGIDFIQMPTTLLAMVDASIGGKLGIDFDLGNLGPVKNGVGLFQDPVAVLIHPGFLSTLPLRELHSGFAEVIKHALIGRASQWKELKDLDKVTQVDWTKLIPRSLEVKKDIVARDPFEKNVRKLLNFGHTAGHALESLALRKGDSLLHGEAVAAGMIIESQLSVQVLGLPMSDLQEITMLIHRLYPTYHFAEADVPDLVELIRQDKKNKGGEMLFSLLKRPGSAFYDKACSEEQIVDALNHYRGLTI